MKTTHCLILALTLSFTIIGSSVIRAESGESSNVALERTLNDMRLFSQIQDAIRQHQEEEDYLESESMGYASGPGEYNGRSGVFVNGGLHKGHPRSGDVYFIDDADGTVTLVEDTDADNNGVWDGLENNNSTGDDGSTGEEGGTTGTEGQTDTGSDGSTGSEGGPAPAE
jgi:hypothetical protein